MQPESIETTPGKPPTDDATRILLRVRWIARAWWALLPLVVGPVLTHGLIEADAVVRMTAIVIAWSAWITGLIALVWAREPGYTAMRVLAPLLTITALIGGVVGTLRGDTTMIAGSVTVLVVAALSCSPIVLQAQLDAASYGSELRFPLQTPPVLYFGLLPLAWACIALGVGVGPLLIAAGTTLPGVSMTIIGIPLAALAMRSVHTLSARWLVLVPAGVVVRDPMILTDPILIPRDHIAEITTASAAPPEGALDLRLGAVVHSIQIRCTEPTEGMRVRKGRNNTTAMDSDRFLVAPARQRVFLAEYHRRARR